MSVGPATQSSSYAAPPPGFDYETALQACARGERGALRKIYEQEAGRLLGVALRIVRRRDMAEEAVHDAFLQIWQKSATFDPQLGSARGWIFSVVRHRALNMLRDTSREQVAGDDTIFEDVIDEAAGPMERLAQVAEAQALKRCLDALDGSKKSSIMLAYLDGCTHNEVAERLKSPLGTVKAWIRRGLLELRQCLST